MRNVVGLDWDDITLDVALERQKTIEEKEKIQTLLYQTAHGFHLELIFKHNISVADNFTIREKYWDDEKRLNVSKQRHMTSGSGHDILFTIKNNHWRVPIW